MLDLALNYFEVTVLVVQGTSFGPRGSNLVVDLYLPRSAQLSMNCGLTWFNLILYYR